MIRGGQNWVIILVDLFAVLFILYDSYRLIKFKALGKLFKYILWAVGYTFLSMFCWDLLPNVNGNIERLLVAIPLVMAPIALVVLAFKMHSYAENIEIQMELGKDTIEHEKSMELNYVALPFAIITWLLLVTGEIEDGSFKWVMILLFLLLIYLTIKKELANEKQS